MVDLHPQRPCSSSYAWFASESDAGHDAVAAPDLADLRLINRLHESCEWFGDGSPLWVARSVRRIGNDLALHVWPRASAPTTLDVRVVRTRRHDDGRACAPHRPDVRQLLRLPLTVHGRRHFARGANAVAMWITGDEFTSSVGLLSIRGHPLRDRVRADHVRSRRAEG